MGSVHLRSLTQRSKQIILSAPTTTRRLHRVKCRTDGGAEVGSSAIIPSFDPPDPKFKTGATVAGATAAGVVVALAPPENKLATLKVDALKLGVPPTEETVGVTAAVAEAALAPPKKKTPPELGVSMGFTSA